MTPTTATTWTRPEWHDLNLSAEIGMYYEDGDGLLELEGIQTDTLHRSDPAPERGYPPGPA